MQRAGTDEGHLVILNRSEDRTWERKIFCREEEVDGKRVTVWGM